MFGAELVFRVNAAIYKHWCSHKKALVKNKPGLPLAFEATPVVIVGPLAELVLC